MNAGRSTLGELILRQLKGGRDFGRADPVAGAMRNFVYLIGDSTTREALVVDPAWDVAGIVDAAAADDLRITGALVTHWHPDHVGGPMMGHDVQGLAQLMATCPVPVHVHKNEAHWVKMMTGLSDADLVRHDSGDRVRVGSIDVECLHTPGHTEGSQCFRCGNALIAGDTLFLEGCGRTDLPGGDPETLWRSLHERLASLPGDTVLYPGHDYGRAPSAPMSSVRENNPVLRTDLGSFLAGHRKR